MKNLAALTLSMLLVSGTAFADTPKDAEPHSAKAAHAAKAKAAKKADKADSAIAAEIEELRQALQSQQQQLTLLKEELAKRDRQIDEAREAAAAANSRAAEASTKATEAVNTTAEVKSTAATLGTTVADIKASNEALKSTVAETAQETKAAETPAAIHIKGITLTPGGFFTAESAWRQRAASADINTPFTGTPFPGNALSKTSEFNASGRQSRIAMLAEGQTEHAKFTGYYETDFLSAAVTSNNRQSNSYSLRQRQFWGQATLDNGWSFTGGQMWSLVTETKKGVQNRTELPPMTIDPQYNVGFGWARQYGFRVAKSFNGDKFVIAVAAEEPQTTFGGRGVPNGTFFINAPGASGGLFNAFDPTGYTVNMAPDFIIKAAADPGWGHYELFGVVSTFRARVYPCGAGITTTNPCPIDGSTANSSVGAFNDSRTGGGIGVNFRAPVFGKYGDFGVHVMGGDGIGRYGSAQLADATARPGGTLAPIRGGQALGTLELHPSPKLDIYMDYGVEYAYRTWYDTSTTTPSSVGYGSPFNNNSGCDTEVLPGNQNAPGAPSSSSCNGDLRNVQEGTIGFWHKVYQGPKGGLRWGSQYSYLVKNTWSGNNNTPGAVGLQPKAIDNMVFTSFRYYLP
ncbi:MAG: hypothetical protein AUH86_20265 [Acidobacteria bacterium 13_1_40CM_4_58_4]|nr:MAG: hypothetical protein AUH86_20265 [Acidobacteria bacterium 13_1_40CM_4_58_4]